MDPTLRESGQQQRVHYSLVALRKHFHVTFLGFAESSRRRGMKERLSHVCDTAEVLPSVYSRSRVSKLCHRLVGWRYQRRSGLKFSNYLIGQVEFSPQRLAPLLANRGFDLALFEYFHAADFAASLRQRGTPCVLDMHNILWQSFARQLDARGVRGEKKQRAVERYRSAEEAAWGKFDALIAISAGERDYAQMRARESQRVFYAPMGVPLVDWSYSWSPTQPPRLAYYGGLGSSHNAQDARRCYRDIMPAVWRVFPEAEFWVVGGNPPPDLCSVAEQNPRVKVTGFVQKVQEVLKTISVLLCPFSGTYGFRSRIIEAMALGVPVVATPDAVYGMDLAENRGLFLAATDEAMALAALRLLTGHDFAAAQSREARKQIEGNYSFENSYGRLAGELSEFAQQRSGYTGNKICVPGEKPALSTN